MVYSEIRYVLRHAKKCIVSVTMGYVLILRTYYYEAKVAATQKRVTATFACDLIQ